MRSLYTAVACLLLLANGAQAESPLTRPNSLLDTGKYIPDIGQFMQIGSCSPIDMTWDGKTIFFNSSMSGAPQAYRLDENGWPHQLTTMEDGIDFFSLNWSGTLAVVGASVGGSEQSQLLLVDARTGQVVQLTNNPKVQFEDVNWSPDDKRIYYRSNEENGKDFFIYEMEIATGTARKIFGDTINGPLGYNSPGGVTPDGGHMLIYNFASNVDNDLYLYDFKAASYVQLNPKRDDTVLYVSASLMPDKKTIWLLCNDNPDGIQRIAKMQVGSDIIEYVNDGWVDPKWTVDGLGFSRDYQRMSAVVNEDGYSRVKMRMVSTGKEIPTPPLEGMLSPAASDKNGNVLFGFSSAARTSDVWHWNPKTQVATQKTFSNYAGIERSVFTEPTLIRYTSFDGLSIPAFLYLPPNYKRGTPIPFIVDAHGGPESQTRPGFVRNYQYLLLNGVGVIAPNPRGSSGYGRTYLELDNYTLRKNSLKDYKAAAEHLFAQGYSAPGMIGIRGGSYGGYVVLGMITEYPDLFSAAIDVVGIANFQSFLMNTAPYRRALREAEYGPLSDSAFLRSVSPLYKAGQIKTPLLVIHGENDPRVPVGEARQIIEAVKANGGIVDSLIFPDEGHGASKRPNIIKEYRKQVAFLKEHLGLQAMTTQSSKR